jgi:hypothetical protein
VQRAVVLRAVWEACTRVDLGPNESGSCEKRLPLFFARHHVASGREALQYVTVNSAINAPHQG